MLPHRLEYDNERRATENKIIPTVNGAQPINERLVKRFELLPGLGKGEVGGS
jgi:predicted nucleic acid-binding OB-fold protein